MREWIGRHLRVADLTNKFVALGHERKRARIIVRRAVAQGWSDVVIVNLGRRMAEIRRIEATGDYE